MIYKISCKCGGLQGELDTNVAQRGNRLLCYCKDCQAFANALEHPEDTLDEMGGTEIIQVSAAGVRITSGHEHLACLKLTENGIGRWYASCCNSPIGNSPGLGMPFIGLIHRALPGADLAQTFGPVEMVFFSKSAVGESTVKDTSLVVGLFQTFKLALLAKLAGAGKNHPFYSVDGTPLGKVDVLSK